MIRHALTRFKTVRPAVAAGVSPAPALRRSLIAHPVPRRDVPPVPLTVLAAPNAAVVARTERLAARGSPLGFRTVGEPGPLQRAPAPAAGVPFLTLRTPLDQTTVARAIRRPQPTPYGASSVGILASGGTTITMVPADLTVQGRTDITQFVAVGLDAGEY